MGRKGSYNMKLDKDILNQNSEIDFVSMAQEVISLMQRDIDTREKLIKGGFLQETYNSAMRKVNNENASRLEEIFNTVGIPTVEKVGIEAYKACWFIVQHSIDHPKFMKRYQAALKVIANQNKTYQVDLAYLSDRINFFEGRPQKYGTQFDWDDNYEMSPYQFDSLEKVNIRRKSLGLNTLEDQIIIMRKHIIDTKQKPPMDIARKKAEFSRWKKDVGWIKRG
jgi:hypothetical protein